MKDTRPVPKNQPSAFHDALTSTAIITANSPAAQHKAFKKKLFPKKAKNCAECSTRIGVSGSKRRHIAAARKLRTTQGDFVSVDAYQLCEQCAENFLAQKWYLLPNVCTDIRQFDLLAFGDHAGGVQ